MTADAHQIVKGDIDGYNQPIVHRSLLPNAAMNVYKQSRYFRR